MTITETAPDGQNVVTTEVDDDDTGIVTRQSTLALVQQCKPWGDTIPVGVLTPWDF